MKRVSWLATGLGAALLLAGCRKSADEAVAKPVDYKGPTIETRNVLMLVSDSARLRVRLKTPLEQDFESGDRLYPEGVELTFMDADGETVINTITGKYGRFERNKSLYTLRGDVRVTNVPKQQRMNTEEAFYDQSKASIYTKPETEITGDDAHRGAYRPGPDGQPGFLALPYPDADRRFHPSERAHRRPRAGTRPLTLPYETILGPRHQPNHTVRFWRVHVRNSLLRDAG